MARTAERAIATTTCRRCRAEPGAPCCRPRCGCCSGCKTDRGCMFNERRHPHAERLADYRAAHPRGRPRGATGPATIPVGVRVSAAEWAAARARHGIDVVADQMRALVRRLATTATTKAGGST